MAGSRPGCAIHDAIRFVRRSATTSKRALRFGSYTLADASLRKDLPGDQASTSCLGGSFSSTIGNTAPLGNLASPSIRANACLISPALSGSSGCDPRVTVEALVRCDESRTTLRLCANGTALVPCAPAVVGNVVAAPTTLAAPASGEMSFIADESRGP